MSLSRWKMMAGVLGVSIGGLAAAASQCPKWDQSKGRSPEAPVAKVEMKVAPAGPASAPTTGPTVPAAPELPPLPAAPQLVPAGPSPMPTPAPASEMPKPAAPAASALLPLPDPTPTPDVKLAKPADVIPTSGALPPIPAGPNTPVSSKPPESTTPNADPKIPAAIPPVTLPPPPAPTGAKPPATPPAPTPPAPTKIDVAPPAPGVAPLPGPAELPSKPTPPVVGASGVQLPERPATPPAAPGMPQALPEGPGGAPVLEVPPAKPPVAPPAAAPAAVADVKFRIVLRVGEGEPQFEVKNGDNLVLKVACEKVDIKSPENGQGLSEVTARGKVRFVGFGAEGTCTELKFMAGTGEVSMTGDVKVQVKDKLGRVESELTTATMKYKIDASAVGGALKP